jgi:WD40 repeat protein
MGSYVVSASVFRSSLLITASTDIIQKDIVTGATQRTFKAHTNKITSFIVIEDNRMITAGYDDMLIVWDLDTASIIKRIWLGASGTLIERIALQGKQVYVGGLDEKVRYVDLNSGSVLRTLSKFCNLIT